MITFIKMIANKTIIILAYIGNDSELFFLHIILDQHFLFENTISLSFFHIDS